MSSHLPDVPLPPTASPLRPRRARTHSITEHSSFAKHHRSHVHRHHDRRKSKDKGKDRDKDKEKDDKLMQIPSFNLQPTQSLITVETGTSRSENPTPAHSQNASRRTSLLGSNAEQDGAIPSWRAEAKGSKEAELIEEKEKGVLRAAELRHELGNLNTLSNHTIRRLDHTYYSVLEKLGVLQNTITSLKELAKMTRQLNEEFETDAGKVAMEVGASLDGFHNFETQKRHIEELAGRVKDGMEKVKVLGARVDVVRDRVEGWEKAEGEWQDRTRKRLRVLWILMSLTAGIMVVLSVFHYTPARTSGLDILSELNISEVVRSVPEMDKIHNETWSLKRNAKDALRNMSNCPRSDEDMDEDPRLRLFDEL